MPPPTPVVFDLGAVLIDWDPRYAYRAMGGTEAEIELFLAHVATSDWNRQFDAGRPFADGIAERKAAFPEHAEWLDAWWGKWPEMLGGPIHGTVDILAELRAQETPLFALTDWSAETFPIARQRFGFLSWFEGVVVSGEKGVTKPDPTIFGHLTTDYGVDPAASVFIDDKPGNVAAAEALGFTGLVFSDPATLRRDLVRLGLLIA